MSFGPIEITQRGSFDNTERYLEHLSKDNLYSVLNKYGTMGVNALSSATPTDTGRTANSWYYEIVQRKGYYSIRWHNSNVNEGRPIAILIQYGHGTGTGGYVQGRDYIMPAIRPIFDQMAAEAWKEVTKI
jgi:hypothetical protein